MPNVRLFNDDALNVLESQPKVKAIITDPPYMINTKSDGSGKLSPWSDYCNAAIWYSEWIRQAKDRLTEDGCLWTFLNWRSMVTFMKASCDVRWPISSVLVWDKEWIGPGMKYLRPCYELIALFAMPKFEIPDRSIADIQRFKWSSTKPHGHPAEKPESLISWLIEHSTQPGDTVLDPFMGSGTTGAAACKLNRNFIGIEQDLQWYDVARARIEKVINDSDQIHQSDVNRCVCCGEIIPEGRQVCPNCEGGKK